MKEKGNLLGRAAWIESRAYRYHIEDPDGNFDKAKIHLQSGGSLIAYINHMSSIDTMILGHVIEDRITSLQNVTGFAAARHMDPSRGLHRRIEIAAIEKGKQELGFNYIVVVQPNEMDRYPDASERNRKAIKQALEILERPGQILGIAPEGTRSKTGNLLKAETRGIELLFKRGGNRVLAMPVAIEPAAFAQPIPKLLPLLTDTRVSAGNPFSYKALMEEHAAHPDITPTDLMMIRLARLLPPGNRGAYANLAS